MQPTITAVRAIGAEYAKRMLLPIILTGALFVIALLALGGWLTTQSAWWWILEVIFIIGAIVFTLIVIVVSVILRMLRPTLTRAEKKSVRNFVDKLERVSENIGTPHVFIVYRVVRDTVSPSRDGFIETMSRDSKTLAPDFMKLRNQLGR